MPFQQFSYDAENRDRTVNDYVCAASRFINGGEAMPEAMLSLKITLKGFAMTEADILSIFEDRPSKPVALWGSSSISD